MVKRWKPFLPPNSVQWSTRLVHRWSPRQKAICNEIR